MAVFKYDTILDDFLEIKIRCDNCNTDNTFSGIEKPDSIGMRSKHKCNCAKCKHIFNIELIDDGYIGKGEIKGLQQNNLLYVKGILFEYYHNMDFGMPDYINGKLMIQKSIDTIATATLEEDVRQYLYRLIFINEFSLMDAYIKSLIYKKIPHNTYKDISFQNTKKVAKFLKKEFNITIDIDILLLNAVETRNKMVHRNALTQEGKVITTSRQELNSILNHIDALIKNINEEFLNLEVNQ